MKFLYDNLSARVSKKITRTYSTSFSLGIYFLGGRLRKPVYAIYGFVRLVDEIVDSFEGYDQTYLLQKFKRETEDAIENRVSLNPVLNSFQATFHQYGFSRELVETFFQSMEMDLKMTHHTRETYRDYIFGSAEVVGLMCLHVFTENDKEKYEELKPYAMKLGAAFQKVNFLRDLKEDYDRLGRIYFPCVTMEEFSDRTKKRIEDDITRDFNIAVRGIKKLPDSSRGGVYLAYVTYQSLFKKIKKMSARQILRERVRINNGKKFALLLNSALQHKLNWI